MDCSPPGSSVHRILQARILEWVAFPSPGDLPDAGIEPGSPSLQADSLLSKPPGKVKVAQWCPTLRPHGLYSLWNSPGQNTGVGSLSLLPGVSPTQGSNPGLPHLQVDSLPAEPQRKFEKNKRKVGF